MAARNNPLPKKSRHRKTPVKQLKKAIPPPDNPLLRYQAEEAARDGESADKEQAARLRLKALEQSKKMPTADATDTTDNTPGSDDQG